MKKTAANVTIVVSYDSPTLGTPRREFPLNIPNVIRAAKAGRHLNSTLTIEESGTPVLELDGYECDELTTAGCKLEMARSIVRRTREFLALTHELLNLPR